MPNTESLNSVINPAHVHDDIKTLTDRVKKMAKIKDAIRFKQVHIFFTAIHADGSESFTELTQNELPFNLPQEMKVLIDQSIEYYLQKINTYRQILLQIEN